MIEFGYLSHVGLRRKLNEDTCYGDSELGVWLVADGMGEGEQGAMASALAREVVVSALSNGAHLEQAVHLANEEITRFSRQHRQQQRAGSTLVAAHAAKNHIHIALIGDSRAYLWHEHELVRLCHSPETMAKLIEHGVLTTEMMNESAIYYARATQAMGITEPEQLQLAQVSITLRSGMQLLLCSDGLTETLEDTALASLLSQAQQHQYSAQECVDHLVAAALDGGGQDNITVIVVQWHGHLP